MPPLTWHDTLAEEKAQPYFQEILRTLNAERAAGITLYPPRHLHFHALAATPLEKVKVVIIGQDPYHGPKQAHGLCFSVEPGCPCPPSLQNIFKELREDCHIAQPKDGCLAPWAAQGVLLLNTVLSVRHGQAHSHANIGWERFTDRIMEVLNTHGEHRVFLLWGSHAQKKASAVDVTRHYVLKAAHPSPLSAHRGFFGCQHFSKTNAYLEKTGQTPINWAL